MPVVVEGAKIDYPVAAESQSPRSTPCSKQEFLVRVRGALFIDCVPFCGLDRLNRMPKVHFKAIRPTGAHAFPHGFYGLTLPELLGERRALVGWVCFIADQPY